MPMRKKQYKKVVAEKVWAIECSPSERLVLLAIAHYQSKDYQPTAEDVAALCGLSTNAVTRLRGNLVRADHLKEIVIAR